MLPHPEDIIMPLQYLEGTFIPLSFLKNKVLFYMCEYFVGISIFAPNTCSAHRGQKTALCPLELELGATR